MSADYFFYYSLFSPIHLSSLSSSWSSLVFFHTLITFLSELHVSFYFPHSLIHTYSLHLASWGCQLNYKESFQDNYIPMATKLTSRETSRRKVNSLNLLINGKIKCYTSNRSISSSVTLLSLHSFSFCFLQDPINKSLCFATEITDACIYPRRAIMCWEFFKQILCSFSL